MARAKTETTADIDGAVDTIEQIASEPAPLPPPRLGE